MSLKDHVKGMAHFNHFQSGVLYYTTDSGLEFEVPIADTGNGIFNIQEKAINMMRWIRPELKKIESAKLECKANEISDILIKSFPNLKFDYEIHDEKLAFYINDVDLLLSDDFTVVLDTIAADMTDEEYMNIDFGPKECSSLIE